LIGIHEEAVDETGHAIHPADLSNIRKIMENNKKWARDKVKDDEEFFSKHVSSQNPKYLWVGCSDSRLPAN
jgi:carbonic anhydrase